MDMVRSDKKRKRMSEKGKRKLRSRVLAFFLIMLLFVLEVLVGRAEESKAELPEPLRDLYAKAAVLMDADSGRILVSKDGEKMYPMASTTKILTCILALELVDTGEVVTVSGEAASQPKVHLGMREGEQFRMIDLLYSLMLESHNDSAVAIAEHVGGSVPGFAQKMNEKAKEIGCENAHFVTPNGLDDFDEIGTHSISASDLARIMSYCITKSPKTKAFLEITQTASYAFSNIEGTRNFSCNNHNAFLSMMEGAISGKTGFTGDAGYCYVGALERDGRTFAVSLLGCGWPNNKNYKWSDTKKLMNYGLEHYAYKDVWEEQDYAPIPVENGIAEDESLSGKATVIPQIDTDDTSLQMLLGDMEEVRVETVQEKHLSAPVKKGQEIGRVSYFLGEEKWKEYTLIAAKEVQERTWNWYLGKVITCWLHFSDDIIMLK